MTRQTFIVAGAGQAGGQAVRELRRLGFEGHIVLVGAEHHYPYERPPLSKSVLADPSVTPTFLGSDVEFKENDIEFLRGTTLDRICRDTKEVVLSDGQRRQYDRLLIATGCKLRQLAIPGLDPSEITYLRTLDDCHDLEARLRKKPKIAIVGGGFIGLEVAATARAMGCDVSVIEASRSLLPRLQCDAVSAAVQDIHEKNGVSFHMHATIEKAVTGRLILTDAQCVDADIIFAGIGVTPNDAVAKEAGLNVDDGILVDAEGRTSDPNIMAAGDVTRQYHPLTGGHVRLESWENANLQALAAAAAMLDDGYHNPAAKAPWVWSDQGDLNIQIAGFSDKNAATVLREFPDEPGSLIAFQLTEGRVTCVISVNRARDMVLLRRLLSANGTQIKPDVLADPDVPIKELLRRP